MSVEGRLAGITSLSLRGRGPSRAFLFEPHRLALPCWALAAPARPATLITLDRHFDLVPTAAPPPVGASVLELDAHARLQLDERNVDHITAAMECGLVGDAIVVARASPVGALAPDTYVDRRGGAHQLLRVPTLDGLVDGYGAARPSPEAARALALLRSGAPTLLDVDLDCFTSPSDADPFTVLPWPPAVVRDFLRLDASDFWTDVLTPCLALTVALEPKHCGGVVAGHALFAQVAQVLFVELLGADLP